MSSLEFAEAARQMGTVIRDHGQRVPTFRSPPRRVGQTRSIRRRADGSATIAVALRGRTMPAIVADMIDGVIVSNGLAGVDAGRLRDDLWEVVAGLLNESGSAQSAGQTDRHLAMVRAA